MSGTSLHGGSEGVRLKLGPQYWIPAEEVTSRVEPAQEKEAAPTGSEGVALGMALLEVVSVLRFQTLKPSGLLILLPADRDAELSAPSPALRQPVRHRFQPCCQWTEL